MNDVFPAVMCAHRNCTHKSEQCVKVKCAKEAAKFFKYLDSKIDTLLRVHKTNLKELTLELSKAQSVTAKKLIKTKISLTKDYIQQYNEYLATKTKDDKVAWFVKYFVSTK